LDVSVDPAWANEAAAGRVKIAGATQAAFLMISLLVVDRSSSDIAYFSFTPLALVPDLETRLDGAATNGAAATSQCRPTAGP
jgi:hypothetical protein